MYVVMVTEEYPPDFGGVGISCQRLAQSLVDEGCQVTVVTFLNGSASAAAEEWGGICHEENGKIRVLRLGPVPAAITTVTSGKVATALKRFYDLLEREINQEKPDILHAFYAYKSGYIAAIVSSITGVPLILSVRGNDISRDIFLPDRMAAFQFSFIRAAAVTFVTKRLRDFALRIFPGIPRPKYIPNSVSIPSRLPQCTKPLPDASIAYIGGIREKKGIKQLLDAFQELRTKRVAHLVLIGEVSKKSDQFYFDCLVKNHPYSDDITVTGFLPRPKMLALANTAAVATFPSLDDGMPNSLLESAALGLPIIVSTIFEDFVTHGKSAIVCDPRDSSAFAKGIEQLLYDKRLAKQISQGVKQLVQTSHLPFQERQAYLNLYDEVNK